MVITGDFIKFEFKASQNGGFNRKWAVLREIVANTSKHIEKALPGVPIISVIGDSDNIFYYHTPDSSVVKTSVYNDLGESFFPNYAPPRSFLDGGYYTKIVGKLTFVGLNTLHWNQINAFNHGPGRDASNQFSWFEKLLKENKALPPDQQKIIIPIMHIPPGIGST